MERVKIIDDSGNELFGMDEALPLVLPGLETLALWNMHRMIGRAFVSNLVACAKLKRVKLWMNNTFEIDQQVLSERETEIGFYCAHGHLHETDLDSESHLDLVKAFGDKISLFEVGIFCWDRRLTTAFEHSMAMCQNLEVLEVSVSKDAVDPEVEQALRRLFDNEERALKVKELSPWSNYFGGDFSQIHY